MTNVESIIELQKIVKGRLLANEAIRALGGSTDVHLWNYAYSLDHGLAWLVSRVACLLSRNQMEP